ncbi:MAG: alpha/beta fold hydrolase [Candidatus Kariarchaeaceae archaeon]
MDKSPSITDVPTKEGFDFLQISYWEPHFHAKCSLKVEYNQLSDNTQILTVVSKPKTENGLKPIVLVAGWFSIVKRWGAILKVISERTTVVYVETRDKTSSILVKTKQTDMSVERMSKDLTEILPSFGIDFSDAICLGSSMGAAILLDYLSVENIYPWRTVLVGPMPKFTFPPIIGRLLLALPLFFVNIGMKYVRWHVSKFKVDKKKEPDQAETYDISLKLADPWKIRESARASQKFDGWALMESINAYVIVVGASTDKLHAAEIVQQIANLIKNGEYIDFQTNKAAHSAEMGKYLLELATK